LGGRKDQLEPRAHFPEAIGNAPNGGPTVPVLHPFLYVAVSGQRVRIHSGLPSDAKKRRRWRKRSARLSPISEAIVSASRRTGEFSRVIHSPATKCSTRRVV